MAATGPSLRAGVHAASTCLRCPAGLFSSAMQTVAETPTFTRQAGKLFSEDEKRELIDYLAGNPTVGDKFPGLNGVRKLRFRASGRGKRGGARVIYFYGGERMPLYALLAYPKSAKTNLTPAERHAIAKIVSAIKEVGKKEP